MTGSMERNGMQFPDCTRWTHTPGPQTSRPDSPHTSFLHNHSDYREKTTSIVTGVLSISQSAREHGLVSFPDPFRMAHPAHSSAHDMTWYELRSWRHVRSVNQLVTCDAYSLKLSQLRHARGDAKETLETPDKRRWFSPSFTPWETGDVLTAKKKRTPWS